MSVRALTTRRLAIEPTPNGRGSGGWRRKLPRAEGPAAGSQHHGRKLTADRRGPVAKGVATADRTRPGANARATPKKASRPQPLRDPATGRARAAQPQ